MKRRDAGSVLYQAFGNDGLYKKLNNLMILVFSLNSYFNYVCLKIRLKLGFCTETSPSDF